MLEGWFLLIISQFHPYFIHTVKTYGGYILPHFPCGASIATPLITTSFQYLFTTALVVKLPLVLNHHAELWLCCPSHCGSHSHYGKVIKDITYVYVHKINIFSTVLIGLVAIYHMIYDMVYCSYTMRISIC